MSPVRGNLGGVVRVCAWPTLHTNWGARKWVKGGAPLPFPHRHSFARTQPGVARARPFPVAHILTFFQRTRCAQPFAQSARRPPPGRTELPFGLCAAPSLRSHKGWR
ncbi:hypothetical protein EDB85DRAFT_1900375, partial [Lactarius pseudohatsudake]